MLDPDTCHAALVARDARFDGLFFVGVATTGIYCRPVCPARTPGRDRCSFHPCAAAAERAGFRACLRCRPELAPGAQRFHDSAPVDAVAHLVDRATALIDAGDLNERGVDELLAFDRGPLREPPADPEGFAAALRTIPGIGEWSAQYLVLRGLHHPDAFPAGDLVPRKALGGLPLRALEARAAAWRPWRAYAALHLWTAHSEAP